MDETPRTRGQIMGALTSSLMLAASDAHHLDPYHTVSDWKECPYERCRERIALVREAFDAERRVGTAMIRAAKQLTTSLEGGE